MKYTLLFAIYLFIFALPAFASIDEVYIDNSSIRFSPENPTEGQKVRVYAVVKNDSDEDVKGTVIFKVNGKQYGDPQPIAVFAKGSDGVFMDLTFDGGEKDIQAFVTDTNLSERSSGEKKTITVDRDSDGDGIGDVSDPDDDNDGLTDAQEEVLGTDPLKKDSDGDGVEDGKDSYPMDSQYSKDSDGDGLPDEYEKKNKLDPFDPSDASLDQDNDNLLTSQEYDLNTNPSNPDTDLDGLPDGWEVEKNLNPLDAGDALGDHDEDTFTNREEYKRGYDPNYPEPEGLEAKKAQEAEKARRQTPQYRALVRLRNTIGIIIVGLILVAAGVYRSKRKG